jgi:hypothetical protein
MAFAYTPEINAEYLKSMQRPVVQQGNVDVGRARGEALRRGLEGDPFEALRVSGAVNNTSNRLTDMNANLAYNVAGLQREERMGTENFNRTTSFQAGEAEKDRQFKERMAVQERAYQDAIRRAQQRAQRRSFWPNLISNVAATGAGAYLGKKI